MKRLFVLFLIFMTVNIYSQEFGTDENDDNYEEFELVFAFETPLALTYGMINGSDIDCSPGAVSHCSPAGCVFQGLLGFIFCAEPVYYYKENEHFFGIANSVLWQQSWVKDYFYIGYILSGSFDLCANSNAFKVGAKIDLDLVLGYDCFLIYSGFLFGTLGDFMYAAPTFGIELSGGLGDEFVIVATYTEGTIFNYPIRRISAGCRFRIEG